MDRRFRTAGGLALATSFIGATVRPRLLPQQAACARAIWGLVVTGCALWNLFLAPTSPQAWGDPQEGDWWLSIFCVPILATLSC